MPPKLNTGEGAVEASPAGVLCVPKVKEGPVVTSFAGVPCAPKVNEGVLAAGAGVPKMLLLVLAETESDRFGSLGADAPNEKIGAAADALLAKLLAGAAVSGLGVVAPNNDDDPPKMGLASWTGGPADVSGSEVPKSDPFLGG